uniref:Protein kinase domain-containing protein n=1 Tax=Steinernema glaseri TaxID=37863 RepID=A0A1I7Y7V6_9BILA
MKVVVDSALWDDWTFGCVPFMVSRDATTCLSTIEFIPRDSADARICYEEVSRSVTHPARLCEFDRLMESVSLTSRREKGTPEVVEFCLHQQQRYEGLSRADA